MTGEHCARAHANRRAAAIDALDATSDERRGLLRLLLVGLDRARHPQERDGRALRHAFDLDPCRGQGFRRQLHLLPLALLVLVASSQSLRLPFSGCWLCASSRDHQYDERRYDDESDEGHEADDHDVALA